MRLKFWTMSLSTALLLNSAVLAADMARMLTPDAKRIETEIGRTFVFAPIFGARGYPVKLPSSVCRRFTWIFLADGGKLETEVFSGLIGGGYTVLEDTTGQLGVVGGALIWSVETTISLQGGIIDGQSRSDGDTWIDAVGGLKGSYSLTPNVYLSGWAPVGGGGADLDWDVAASLGFKFTRPFQLCSDIVPSTSISKTVVSNSTSSNRGASSPWSFNSSSKPDMGDWD